MIDAGHYDVFGGSSKLDRVVIPVHELPFDEWVTLTIGLSFENYKFDKKQRKKMNKKAKTNAAWEEKKGKGVGGAAVAGMNVLATTAGNMAMAGMKSISGEPPPNSQEKGGGGGSASGSGGVAHGNGVSQAWLTLRVIRQKCTVALSEAAICLPRLSGEEFVDMVHVQMSFSCGGDEGTFDDLEGDSIFGL